jgi:hypothetical protein
MVGDEWLSLLVHHDAFGNYSSEPRAMAVTIVV